MRFHDGQDQWVLSIPTNSTKTPSEMGDVAGSHTWSDSKWKPFQALPHASWQAGAFHLHSVNGVVNGDALYISTHSTNAVKLPRTPSPGRCALDCLLRLA